MSSASLDPGAEALCDPLALDSRLEPEELVLRDQARSDLAAIAPAGRVAEWYERGGPPRELLHELGRAGFLLPQVEGYGRPAETAVGQGLLAGELESVDSGIRSMAAVHGSLAGHAIYAHGSDAQKEEWLPRMIKGEAVGSFCLTEPNVGSDPSSMETVARRRAGDWVLNGNKAWVTNGPLADIAVVWAMTDEGVCGFLVPLDAAGVEMAPVDNKLSLRISKTGSLRLDEVVLPGDAILPGGKGLGAAFACLSEARFGIAWGTAALARACLEVAVEYAISRTQFRREIGSFQLVQARIAEMAVDCGNAGLLALHLGRLKDEGGLTPAQISVGKLSNTRVAVRTAQSARRVLGANGILGSFPLMRHMANLETVSTYEGTEEVHTLVLGGKVTGLAPAFR